MALIKYGGGVASMSGKQGGAVHGRGRTGATIRDWTKPCNPANASQSQARARFAQQSAGWGNLTDTLRDQWNAFAQTQARANRQGDIYVPTGRQMYVELNANKKLIESGELDTPPVGSVPPSIDAELALEIQSDTGALSQMQITGGDTDAAVKWVVNAAPAQMTGRNNVNRQMRKIGFFSITATLDLKPAYIALFGDNMPLDARVQVEVFAITIATGLASPKLTLVTNAVAA